jgi:hypothetical protein
MEKNRLKMYNDDNYSAPWEYRRIAQFAADEQNRRAERAAAETVACRNGRTNVRRANGG